MFCFFRRPVHQRDMAGWQIINQVFAGDRSDFSGTQ